MNELTLNDHFRCGYDGDLSFQRRQRPAEKFQALLGRCASFPTFRAACKAAAEAILAAEGPPPAVLLSGGIDSETCVRAFLDAGHVPEVVIARLGRHESQDFNVARWVAKHLKLRPHVVEIDVLSREGKIKVLQAGIFAQTISPQFATHCQIIEAAARLGFRPVLAIGDNELRLNHHRPVVVEREKETFAYKFASARRWERTVPAFFQYTPELVWSRLAGEGSEIWAELTADNYFKVKEAFHLYHYPDIAPREKRTGFEELGWEWDFSLRSRLRELLPAGSETELEFNLSELCAYLSGAAPFPTPASRLARPQSNPTA